MQVHCNLQIRRKRSHIHQRKQEMSALFNFHSFLTVVLLGICTCTFVKMHFPAILEQRTGYIHFFTYCFFCGSICVADVWTLKSALLIAYNNTNSMRSLLKGLLGSKIHKEFISVASLKIFRGFFWKAARIGLGLVMRRERETDTCERLSPWVAVGCITMGVSIIFF
ncbi:hypothetical protein DKX38_013289 [Salix brachista]|uniref:Protein kish n=1 Tax=Salix brachista TaxID=2182728 RepID=A0A5N5LQY1_9ROSI|nr:hypothetical protein DKX38_013289 [Salix brachista]